jgi:hypothetical protein
LAKAHWLLVRRQINPPPGKDPELAFYRCAGPATTPVPELIRVAGARWAIEECFQTAKNEAATRAQEAYLCGAVTARSAGQSRWPRSRVDQPLGQVSLQQLSL